MPKIWIKKDDGKEIPALRNLLPYQRLKIAFELHDFALSRIKAEIRRQYPHWTEAELLSELNK